MLRYLIRAALLALLLTLAARPGLAQTANLDLEPVQQDVKELNAAIYRGDIDAILRFTHPKAIEMLGGQDAARAALEQGLLPALEAGMTLETLTFPSPPEYLRGQDRRFVIVPTLSVMSFQGERIESLNFQFGVLESGIQGWSYLEGSRVNKENVQSLFPDFPADYTFPEIYRRKL